MVVFPVTLTDPNLVFKVAAFLKKRNISNLSNDIMFGDLDWPLNTSRGFVSIAVVIVLLSVRPFVRVCEHCN